MKLAQVQLENALEAALAAVKQWKDSDSTSQARDFAVSYAMANKVGDVPVSLDRNDGGGGANDNLTCDGDIVLGSATAAGNEYDFDADTSPSPGGGGNGNYAARVAEQMTVTPICQNLFGYALGPFEVCAEANALCEAPDGFPKLIRVNQFLCN